MSIIQKALDEIKFRIPIQIVQAAFVDDTFGWRQQLSKAPVSLDNLVYDKLIKPRVLIDCNLVGGQEVIISLDGLTAKFADTYHLVYEIPSDRLNNREIISVLSINYIPYSANLGNQGYGSAMMNTRYQSDLMSTAQRVNDSFATIPATSNATADLIGFNTVLLKDTNRISNAYQLRCIVSNQENLSNINPRSWPAFCKLVELAVKSYIYNKLIIKIDQAFLMGGQELGSFKDIVSSYSDHEEMYQTYLRENWAATAVCNDVTQHQRLIKSMINPTI